MDFVGHRNQMQRWRKEMDFSAVFSPLNIAGLRLWYDFSVASQLFTDVAQTTNPVDTNTLAAAKDRSINDTDILQGVAGSRPIYRTNIQNGLSVARFDGTADFMATGAITLNQPEHVIAIMINRSIAASDGLFGGNAGNTMLLFENAGNLDLFTASIGPGITTPSVGETFIVSCLFNGISSVISKNNEAEVTGDVGAGSGSGLTIGSRATGLFPAGIDIGEIFVYNTALTATQKTDNINYLNNKWAVF